MRLVDISVFPVKSARGLSLTQAEVTPRGLAGDRRWMIVDANGRAVTQREIPQLAMLSVAPAEGWLNLAFGAERMAVARPAAVALSTPVRIWGDELVLPEAADAGPWLSQLFGQELRLVYQPDSALRPVVEWAEPGDHVSLADGFPILVATTAALDAFNRAAGLPLQMNRFRPNLVVEGAEAWAEDSWARLRVGAVELDIVKPCARCTLTTVDQDRGAFAGEEPLATLRRIRMSGDRRVPGVLFGWNAVPRRLGTVHVGDPVEVLATRAAWPLRAERLSAVG